MKKYIVATNLINKLDRMMFRDVVDMFQIFTGQSVPEDAIFTFYTTGLTNQDFLFSDFLHRYDLKNLNDFNVDLDDEDYLSTYELN